MSVAGILDAMRSDLPLSQRVVWQCLENHANGHRFWSISIKDMADELHLRTATVCQAVKELERLAIIRVRRAYKMVSTYFMLRSYDASEPHTETVQQPPKNAPETVALGCENRTTVDDENRQVVNPPSKNPPREERSLRSLRAREADPEPDLFPEVGCEPQPPEPTALAIVPPAEVEASGSPGEAVAQAWNAMAVDRGLPVIRVMTPAREKALAARIREVGRDGMLTAIAKIGASSHCRGQNDLGWHADFDFLLQPKSLIRAIEGRYDDRPAIARPRPGSLAEFTQSHGIGAMQPSFDPEPIGAMPTIRQ